MGFLDKLKQQATDVASTVAEKTQETAKVGQLQVQLRNLRGEERDALNEFGREAYNLHEADALAERSGELAGAAAKIADIRAQIADKEQEIAAVRSDSGGDGDTPAARPSRARPKRSPSPRRPPSRPRQTRAPTGARRPSRCRIAAGLH